MIQEFLDTWDLFLDAYVTGWLAAAALSVLGVYLLAADQVFLGAALGQAAACGVAVAGALATTGLARLLGESFHAVSAVVFSLATVWLAAGLTARRRAGPVLAFLFVLFGAGAVVAATRNPHGMQEIQELMTSSLLASHAEETYLLALVALLVVPAGFLLRWRVLFCLLDPEAARVQGLRPGITGGFLAAAWGVAAGVAMHSTGLLFTFGMLVLPALLARRLCSTATASLWVAPASAVAATALAYVLAVGWDLPPGPLAVLLLGAAVAVTAGVKRRQ